MADKKGLDVGLIFGPPPKGGGAVGPDSTQMALGADIFDTAKPMKDRIRALHDYIHMCIDDAEASEDTDADEAGAGGEEKSVPGGY